MSGMEIDTPEGGTETSSNGMDSWQTPEVVAFLQKNDLGLLAPIFEENEVTGLDLLLLTEAELKSMLKISKLQAAKIKVLIDADAAGPDDEDPADTNDFSASNVPRISDRNEDYGDEAEQSELRRAGTGVNLTMASAPQIPGPASAAPAATAATPAVPGPASASPAATAATPAVTDAVAAGAPTVVGTVLPVNVPVLPTGTGALRLDAAVVERYQQCVATITALEAERVAQELPGARSRLDSTKKRLKLQEDEFEELRKQEAEQNEKLKNLVAGKWYPGKYIFGAQKREEKIERNTEKLEKVSNEVRAAGAQLEKLNVAAEAQANVVSELMAKCASLDEARNFCSSLLQSAFAGGSVGDSRENLLETEVAALGPKMEEVRRYKSVYGKAYELMRGSRKALDQARQLLESASTLATVDVVGNVMRPRGVGGRRRFQPTPAGLMVDMVKRARMRQGVELCRTSGDLAIKARGMVPDMPRVNAEKLNRLRAGFGLFDVVFDNMISDLIVARKIRGMLGTVRDVQSDVQYAERWLEGWIRGRIDTDLKAMEAQLASKRVELHSHRMQLMHQWIEARARGAVQEAPQQPLFPPAAQAGVAVGTPLLARQYIL